MATVLLVRHARTPETGRRLTGRLPGVSLDEQGRAEAEALGATLASVPVTAVFTSPIERTVETAELVAAPHGLRPRVEDGLVEVDYGRWAGRTLAQLRRTKLWSAVQATPSRVRFPDGEAIADVQHRAVEAVERIAGEVGRRTAIAVSHADVIKTVLAWYLGQPLDLFQRLVIAPASVSVVHLGDGPPRVAAIGVQAGGATWT